MATTNGTGHATNIDALVVGAGFSGVAMLYRLRKLGIPALVVESGADFGGVWYWNRYPGARVDSEWPYYQLNIPEVYNSWTFTERFPGYKEIRKYFDHIESVLHLKKDVSFNTHVHSCRWIEDEGLWEVRAKVQKGDWQGQTEATNEPEKVIRCKYLVMCTGLLHRRHYPDFPGLMDYKGVLHHTGFYPEDASTKGKKVAIVGAGATAVQVVQEVAKEADHLTCFFRRPSFCLPMKQRVMSQSEQDEWKTYFPTLFSQGRLSQAGFPSPRPAKMLAEDEPAERKKLWDSTWQRGGFQWLMTNYADVVLNKDTNREVYAYWAKQVRERIKNEKKKDLLAPLGDRQPYWISTKRLPLEQDYYECMDQDNVDIVDLNEKQFKKFNEKGVELSDGTQLDFDVIILATGFDSFSGSLTNIGLKNKDGVDIKDYWSDGVKTYLGMMFNGFPNAYTCYTPHAPTALSNGPTIIEAQCDCITAMISASRDKKIKTIQPTATAQVEWQALINMMNEHTLFPLTNSWWNAANVPGKAVQMLTYPAGIKMYEEHCTAMMKELKGFEVEYWDGTRVVEGKANGDGITEKEDAQQVKKELDVGGLNKGLERGEVVLGVAGG